MSTYATNLIAGLTRTYTVDSDRIVVDVQVSDVHLAMDAAVHCGLLLNELVSNALTHAFPGGAGGHVVVTIKRRDDGMVVLTVRDDGVGLPEDFDISSSQTLGLRLIVTLVAQIDGTLDVRRGGRTEFVIAFNAEGRPSEAR